MPKYLYKEVTVPGTANSEESATLLTAPENKTYQVDALLPTEVTGTLQGDSTLKAWKEREKVVEADIRHTLSKKGSNVRYEMPWLPLGLELLTGQRLIVGHVSGGTASNVTFLVKYHEV